MFTARHYSQALFLLAKEEKKLNKFLSDLELVIKTIKKEANFKNFLLNPEILFAEKIKILKPIFKNKILPQTYNFIFLLIKKNCLKLLDNIFFNFKKKVLEDQKVQEVEIVFSMSPPSSFRLKIARLLEKKIGKEVKLLEKIEPKILGGMVIKIGDELVDLSLRQKLEVLYQNLV